MRIGIVLALTVMTVGCGFSARNSPTDARDAAMGSDATTIATGRQQMEIVAGAGRVTTGTKTIDIEVGHAVLVRNSSVGTITITGAQVVKP